MDFLEKLYADEAVCFIAGRHETTPQKLLQEFLAGSSGIVAGRKADRIPALESNEMEILRGLVNAHGNGNVENFKI